MKIQIVIHKAEEGGYWGEVPSIPGCASQGETVDELRRNLREAIEGCLSVEIATIQKHPDDQVITIAV